MTTLSMNSNTIRLFAGAPSAPRQSFAARLAARQLRLEQTKHLRDTLAAAAGLSLALVPVLGLAWMFVAL